jgi:hypothetical protein
VDKTLLASFSPSADALHRRIAGHIDDAMLQHIAELDYGMSVDVHLRELKTIRDDGVIARPLKWEPREVLSLNRWAEPDVPDPIENDIPGIRGHWARAFCCAVLIRAYGDAETREIEHSGYSASIIMLLESLGRLDAGYEREAMSALAWFITRLRESNEDGVEDEIAFAGVGLLALAVRARGAVPDTTLLDLARWLIVQEQSAFDYWGKPVGDFPNHWLFRTSHFMKPEKWIALGRELAAFDGAGESGEAVRAVGRKLSGEVSPFDH